MSGSRHARLALLAVSVAFVIALAPPAGSDVARVGPVDAAARVSPASPSPRFAPWWALRPDNGVPHADGTPPGPPSPAALMGYVWPLANARLTLGYQHTHWGSRLVEGELFHDGIDLATFCGDEVVAAHDGVVLAAGRRYDDVMGWQGDLTRYYSRLDEKRAWGSLPIVIVIDDGNGYRSIYAHFSRVTVEPGERVRAGQLIGYEGATGRASGCHLHYGLFAPAETAVFEISPAVVDLLEVPRFQTARIDPRLVLPDPRASDGIPELRPAARPSAPVPAVRAGDEDEG